MNVIWKSGLYFLNLIINQTWNIEPLPHKTLIRVWLERGICIPNMHEQTLKQTYSTNYWKTAELSARSMVKMQADVSLKYCRSCTQLHLLLVTVLVKWRSRICYSSSYQTQLSWSKAWIDEAFLYKLVPVVEKLWICISRSIRTSWIYRKLLRWKKIDSTILWKWYAIIR